MDITGASAIVTGGASGIGAAVVRRLASQGAHVVIADVDEHAGRELAGTVGGSFVRVDVTDTEQIEAAILVAERLGPLRVLVNSAGIAVGRRTLGRDGTAHDLDLYRKVIEVNLVGTFDAIRLVATAMSRTDPLESGERGAICNLASVSAFDGQVGQAAYAASKAGVVGLTLPVARDLAAIGVRVNAVAPGPTATGIHGHGEAAERFKTKLGASVVFPQRFGEPEEMASMILQCLTNSYLNGETIRVDGAIRLPAS